MAENDDKNPGGTSAEDMGGGVGITGGGDSGGPGEGVRSKDSDATEGDGGAGAPNLNAGQPTIGQEDQPDMGHGGGSPAGG
jgi:hypothetical protein